MPKSPTPKYLDGATDFSSDAAELHPLAVIKLLKAQPQFWSQLADATDLDRNWGRPRLSGQWALAYLAFVFSKQADVLPWWQSAGHSIWRTAGFRERPSYQATWKRFAELEEYADAFLETAQALIQRAVKASGGEVGRYLHVDATEAETNARLVHLCKPGSPCRRGADPRGGHLTAG